MKERNFVIKFRCKNCGQKIKVPQTHTGKKGKCPKCKNIVVVPKINKSTSVTSQDSADKISDGYKGPAVPHIRHQNKPSNELSGENNVFDHIFEEMQEYEQKVPKVEYKASDQLIKDENVFDKDFEETQTHEEKEQIEESRETDKPEETEETSERKLPWVIDIFLYPINTPGLTVLGIIIVIPLSIRLTAGLLGPLGFFISIPGSIINITIGMYAYWYFAECVRDSAGGRVRAPETIGNPPRAGELFWQLIQILCCLAFFFAPLGVYFSLYEKTDIICWSLLGYGVFLFPMALLAVLMFDSFSGLNPILLIGSIFSTFFQYCGLALLFMSTTIFTIVAGKHLKGHPFLHLVLGWLRIYLGLVGAHLLGRFYWRYQEKLNWEV